VRYSDRLKDALSHAHPAAIAIVAGWERLALALCKVGAFYIDNEVIQ
jgi:hypothetical protein